MARASAFAAAAKKKPFARTIRFIAFGTEEQLSVGARAYAIAHRKQMDRHALMINLDSLSCALGHTQVLVAGSTQLEKWMLKNLKSAGITPRVFRQVTPFADHFPFTMFGVPALWFARPNFGGMRWQHHSTHDNLSTVSADAVCTLLNAIAPLAANVADARSLPFKAGIDKTERPEIKRLALELFDMRI
jgi:Zn-dependent M28 family amino/carboxypeptidase